MFEMFSSFFGKKKTADTPTEETDPIPSHDAQQPGAAAGGEEFIFVERKGPDAPGGSDPLQDLYPIIPPGGRSQQNAMPVPYMQGVPFKFSPELSNNDTYDTIQMELDGILAMMTRQLHFDSNYDFALERSLMSE